MDFSLTINGYLFKHLCDVIFDGLLSVVYPWFVIQATSINTQSLTLLINQNLQNWKKTFLANAEIAMDPSKAVKEYKEELIRGRTSQKYIKFNGQSKRT
jgi:hypothetical protein